MKKDLFAGKLGRRRLLTTLLPVAFVLLFVFQIWFTGFSEKKHVEKWLENNRDCTVVSHQGGRIQHFDSNGGFYAQYYNYVLFKK